MSQLTVQQKKEAMKAVEKKFNSETVDEAIDRIFNELDSLPQNVQDKVMKFSKEVRNFVLKQKGATEDLANLYGTAAVCLKLIDYYGGRNEFSGMKVCTDNCNIRGIGITEGLLKQYELSFHFSKAKQAYNQMSDLRIEEKIQKTFKTWKR